MQLASTINRSHLNPKQKKRCPKRGFFSAYQRPTGSTVWSVDRFFSKLYRFYRSKTPFYDPRMCGKLFSLHTKPWSLRVIAPESLPFHPTGKVVVFHSHHFFRGKLAVKLPGGGTGVGLQQACVVPLSIAWSMNFARLQWSRSSSRGWSSQNCQVIKGLWHKPMK